MNSMGMNSIDMNAPAAKLYPAMDAALPPKNKGLIRVLIGITALAVVGLSAGLLLDRLYQPADFQLREVALLGNPQHVAQQQLKEAVTQALAGNYFSIDMAAIQQAMGQFAWVDEVRIRRRWPDTLMIEVIEHQPVARWGSDKVLTTKGKLVSLPLPKPALSRRGATWLPTLSGQQNQQTYIYQQYQAWAAAFSNQGLRLIALDLSPQHLWTLTVEVLGQQPNTSFVMVLLEENSAVQLARFLQSIRQNLIAHPRAIQRVDLRYSSGFAIKWHPQTLKTAQ